MISKIKIKLSKFWDKVKFKSKAQKEIEYWQQQIKDSRIEDDNQVEKEVERRTILLHDFKTKNEIYNLLKKEAKDRFENALNNLDNNGAFDSLDTYEIKISEVKEILYKFHLEKIFSYLFTEYFNSQIQIYYDNLKIREKIYYLELWRTYDKFEYDVENISLIEYHQLIDNELNNIKTTNNTLYIGKKEYEELNNAYDVIRLLIKTELYFIIDKNNKDILKDINEKIDLILSEGIEITDFNYNLEYFRYIEFIIRLNKIPINMSEYLNYVNELINNEQLKIEIKLNLDKINKK